MTRVSERSSIWVATALPFEARDLARALGGEREATGRGWSNVGRLGECRVRLLVTGPGAERVERAAVALAEREALPAMLLTTGVAGALRPELGVGEIVVASAVCDRSGGSPVATDAACRTRARQALLATGLRWREGVCLGVDRVLPDAHAKRRAAASTGADVVQMEDHVWARQAASWGIPFLSVRVVLDAIDQAIPAAALAFPWRGPGAGEVAVTLLRSPQIAPALAKLGAAQRRARRALARFLEVFLASSRGPLHADERREGLPSPP